MKRVKVGLALGSGAAKGLAHIGVIQALEEKNIPIHVVAGASIGSVVGGMYAAGLTIDELKSFAFKFADKHLAFWIDPSLFKSGGLLKGGKIEDAIKDEVGLADFSDLKIPFYAVATDLVSGRPIVMHKGDPFRAIRASFAIPGIFAPTKVDGKWLVDGALSDPIPTEILQKVNCDVIISVNVSSVSKKQEAITLDESPRIIDVLMQVVSIAQDKLAEPCMDRADINIVPNVGPYSWSDFSKVEELIGLGYRSTMRMMPELEKLLKKKKKFRIFR